MKILVYKSDEALMQSINKLTKFLPDKLYLHLFFFITHKKLLRLRNPRSISEKYSG